VKRGKPYGRATRKMVEAFVIKKESRKPVSNLCIHKYGTALDK